ncbi:MAG: glycosyltransferase family 39 protein [Patescibacteria group bacterium]|nr:glycosyltransferase family 39 protein [Patescibacteria group bacterium]
MREFFRLKYIVVGVIILFFYFATRLTNLTILPIFTDEAIYIRWSQIGSQDANWRFISLTDGKQPLFTWIMMGTLRIFSDPLVAGRMVSVVAGLGTLFGLAILSYELFRSKRIVILTCALYILSPFSLMYDRLALYDSLTAAFAVWNIYLSVLLARYIRLDVALLLGLCLGAGMLNKTSGFISLYLLPLSLLLFNFQKKHWKRRLLQWCGLALIAFMLSQLVYGVLRLSPYYHMIAQKDFVFVHPFKNFYFIYQFFPGNFRGLLDWLIGYLTLPIFLLALVALISRKRSTILLFLYCLLPMIGLAYFGKVLYPRFILFMAMPLLILAAHSFDYVLVKLGKRLAVIFVSSIILFPSVRASYYIITNPLYAPIPYSDRGQFLDDWPSGYGVKESIEFLKKEAEKGKIAVYTEGTFGLFPYAIEMYLVQNPNVLIKGIWPLPDDIPPEIVERAAQMPTYLITNQTQTIPDRWPLELIAEYQKGTNPTVKLRLFRVIQSIAYNSLP